MKLYFTLRVSCVVVEVNESEIKGMRNGMGVAKRHSHLAATLPASRSILPTGWDCIMQTLLMLSIILLK